MRRYPGEVPGMISVTCYFICLAEAFTAPITVMPEYIRTCSCSYNTQMGWTDYMGYPGSEL